MVALITSGRVGARTVACLLKRTGYVTRDYQSLSQYNIKWVRPEKIPSTRPEKSGDMGLDVNIKPTDVCYQYLESTELREADENVKKLLTVAFHHKRETNILRQEKIIDMVKRHKLDRGSKEAKIAMMTGRIHRLQENMELHPMNGFAKSVLKELIDKRKKHLKELRMMDYKCFEWLLQKLNLQYKPQAADMTLPHRKDSLRKLTKKQCDSIIQQKLDTYKALLHQRQKEFFKEKAEKLAFIRAEEIACGITPTVTEEDIERARRKAAELQ